MSSTGINTRAEATKLNFHPHFDIKTPNATIFESSDDVHFYYDWEPLAMLSSFFKDLKSIGSATYAQSVDGTQIIPLPATSTALSYAFTSITRNFAGQPPPPAAQSAYDDIVTLADSLSLPLVLRSLLFTAKAAKLKPAVIFTLAILAKDCTEWNAVTPHLLPLPFQKLDPWSKNTLLRLCPRALVALCKMEIAWHDSLGALVAKGDSQLLFHLDCTVGCPNQKVHGSQNFSAVLKPELVNIKLKLIDNPSLILSNTLYKPDLGCFSCNSRAGATVRKIIANVLPPTSYTFTTL